MQDEVFVVKSVIRMLLFSKFFFLLQQKIQKFSLQLLHDKKHQIALGIISLDLTLLATVSSINQQINIIILV